MHVQKVKVYPMFVFALLSSVLPAFAAPKAGHTLVVRALVPPIPQDCLKAAGKMSKSEVDAKDMQANFTLGLNAYQRDDFQVAVETLSISAAQLYPPSVYLLSFMYQQDDRIATAEPLLRCAAELGFQKAEWDLGGVYADQRSRVHNDPKAFAWLSLAAEHEREVFGEIIKPQAARVYARMSERDKGKARRLKALLLEQLLSVPKFKDAICCASSGGSNPRE